MAVLGDEQTRDKIVLVNSSDEFIECGAFCVKFYSDGAEDIIIIDDYLPMLDGEFYFARNSSEDEIKELWPCIIEKAYAKKYGSYSNIIGGFVSSTLAELTNGIPETMNKKDN